MVGERTADENSGWVGRDGVNCSIAEMATMIEGSQQGTKALRAELQ